MADISKGTRVAFDGQIKVSSQILASIDLLERHLRQPSYAGAAGTVRKMDNYRDEWSHFAGNSLFDLQLVDGSILQFKIDPESRNELSFSYYESPLAVEDYASFLQSHHGVTFDEVGDVAREEYDDYLSSADLKRSVTMLRYDYSPALYREGCHPASHIHIGHRTQVRIGTHRVMNPISFTLFVLRQAYPFHWEKVLTAESSSEHMKHVRSALAVVGPQFNGPKDSSEVQLA